MRYQEFDIQVLVLTFDMSPILRSCRVSRGYVSFDVAVAKQLGRSSSDLGSYVFDEGEGTLS